MLSPPTPTAGLVSLGNNLGIDFPSFSQVHYLHISKNHTTFAVENQCMSNPKNVYRYENQIFGAAMCSSVIGQL